MVNSAEQRGWMNTRRRDSVIKETSAEECAKWILSNQGKLDGYQVDESERFFRRVGMAINEPTVEKLHKRLTLAVQQFISRTEWSRIRQHFYRSQRQARDGFHTVAVTRAVRSDLHRLKKVNGFDSIGELIDDMLSVYEADSELTADAELTE